MMYVKHRILSLSTTAPCAPIRFNYRYTGLGIYKVIIGRGGLLVASNYAPNLLHFLPNLLRLSRPKKPFLLLSHDNGSGQMHALQHRQHLEELNKATATQTTDKLIRSFTSYKLLRLIKTRFSVHFCFIFFFLSCGDLIQFTHFIFCLLLARFHGTLRSFWLFSSVN